MKNTFCIKYNSNGIGKRLLFPIAKLWFRPSLKDNQCVPKNVHVCGVNMVSPSFKMLEQIVEKYGRNKIVTVRKINDIYIIYYYQE